MENTFVINGIIFCNGNKNFKIEIHDKTLNSTTISTITDDAKLVSSLEALENVSQFHHEEIDIVLITNSFYENSLDLLNIFKAYPKLFSNTVNIKVCITTFLMMGFNPARDSIPERIKDAFIRFQNDASNIGYTLIDYHGEKLVTDKKEYLLSDFLFDDQCNAP